MSGVGGLSYFPPGYRCLYITHNSIEPFDVRGWMNLAVTLVIGLLVLYGGFSFLIRMAVRARTDSASLSSPRQ